MVLASNHTRLDVQRHNTKPGQDPYDTVRWERRYVRISHYKSGEVSFDQPGVEVPATWSQNASAILAQKYFRREPGSDAGESSLKQVADRVVDTISRWGVDDGYFDDATAEIFAAELKYALVHQIGAFNSPVWFNIGVPGVPQQASACFILAVEDRMDSILNWYVEEGAIFKGGSGAGCNLSELRSSSEPLKGGGTASGPVSFMRGADASAGTIKSGGKTRRAAKMVILDVDHPDIEEFIWCKAIEEEKARVLRNAGFDMGLDGSDSFSIQYQNANNSVRVTDEFMTAVEADASWDLLARSDGSVVRTVRARSIMRQLSEASWQCADPGIQFDTTVNAWHTSPASGKINGSNPCSEYMHLDNSACNLASINLKKFLDDAGIFDVVGFKFAVGLFFMAQDILVGRADYPTAAIAENSHKFRQLGLGYANLGALLMSLGMAYDSDEGRSVAASITALMTGHAYNVSAEMAALLGPHEGYAENAEPMFAVLQQHRSALEEIDTSKVPDSLVGAAHDAWDTALINAAETGLRNAQATVLAPTGTIGLLMDCDTTGVEPDLGLCKLKKLVGGGTMMIVNQSVPRALAQLGYSESSISRISEYIDANKTILGAPELDPQHVDVFACSMGDNPIHYSGHIKMMAAIQPFISGAISKTVNMPESASVTEIEQLHADAWKMGVKAIAIYRDNCKVAQPLTVASKDPDVNSAPAALDTFPVPAVTPETAAAPVRDKLPRDRRSRTFEFRVADCKGFVTVGEYDDGRPGEVFLRVSKQGSTLAGIMDALAISLSHGLQYGVPLQTFVSTFTGMRFEPAGITDDPEIRIASSIIDYLFRKLAVLYLSYEERAALGIFTTGERSQQTLPGVEPVSTDVGVDLGSSPLQFGSQSTDSSTLHTPQTGTARQMSRAPQVGNAPQTSRPKPVSRVTEAADRPVVDPDAPICMQCGVSMRRAGSCFVCSSCGSTSGCS